MSGGTISVFLADDNLIVREGVRALLALEADVEVVGHRRGLRRARRRGRGKLAPQVVVTDIRMPPSFQHEGIEAAHEIRKRHPGTGIVILSQFDDPEYAISLLDEGAAGCAYLLKDRIAEGDQLARAVRAVATGGSVLDPTIVESMVHPVTDAGDAVARPRRSSCTSWPRASPSRPSPSPRAPPPAAAAEAVERLFLRIAQQASAGGQNSLRRLRMLHEAIVNREEQGETLSRLLPGGVADLLVRRAGSRARPTELVVSVLMSDIRGYSTIAERADPSALAGQLNVHRAEMNRAILDVERHRHAVRRRRGDGGLRRPGPDGRPRRAGRARPPWPCTPRRRRSTPRWRDEGLPPFGLGIGVTTGPVAAALLGSEERLEYTLVGDTVNLVAAPAAVGRARARR